MFIALDKDNNKISIEQADKNAQYFCPQCGAPLIIKAVDSLAVKAHFAHRKGSDCDSFSHDMSDWHLDWQKKFPIENREVVIEKDGIKHRADVCINNTVIEFQHSPITAEEISQRNEFYLSCGYNMIWIFDANDQLKNECGDSIDPVRCRSGDLCWKRAKRQFAIKMPPKVNVFVEYKTEVSVPQLNGQQVDIMLLLQEVEPKYLKYYSTQINTKYYYLLPQYLLKEFGLIEENIPTISAIVNSAIEYQKQLARSTPRSRTIYIPRYRRGRRF